MPSQVIWCFACGTESNLSHYSLVNFFAFDVSVTSGYINQCCCLMLLTSLVVCSSHKAFIRLQKTLCLLYGFGPFLSLTDMDTNFYIYMGKRFSPFVFHRKKIQCISFKIFNICSLTIFFCLSNPKWINNGSQITLLTLF